MTKPYASGLDRNEANYTPLTPVSFLAKVADVYPERVAVIHGSLRRSWKDVYARCRRLASALARRGVARGVARRCFRAGINARYDGKDAIGKRYRRHDEAGTPFCLTIDGQTREDGTITIRDRDTMKQDRIRIDDAVEIVKKRLDDGA